MTMHGARDEDGEKRRKDLANKRFEREEMGELLKLFSALGVTVTAGIIGSFLAGLWIDKQLGAMGWNTYGLPRILGVLAGLGLALYWAHLRIVKHLRKFEERMDKSGDGEPDDSRPEKK